MFKNTLDLAAYTEDIERPVTVTIGTNILVGDDKEKLITELRNILTGNGKKGAIPPLRDGNAGDRKAGVLENMSQ